MITNSTWLPLRHLTFVMVIMALAAALSPLYSSWIALAQSEPHASRIVAAGDFHGDYAAYNAVVTGAGLVDADGNWTGGTSIFIQVGDLPDRGPDTRQIITELRALQIEAEQAGGQIIVLVGNHEALLMAGDYRYLHPGEVDAYRNAQSETRRDEAWLTDREEILRSFRRSDPGLSETDIRTAWENQTPLGLVELAKEWSLEGETGNWVKNLPAIVVIDDTLFVHGGLSALYADYSIEEINRAAQAAFSAQTRDRSAIINDQSGPLWYRGLHRDPGERVHLAGLGALTIEEELDLVLDAFNVSRIVVGHTPNLDGIAVRHNNRVIGIDTGMSAAYNGIISWLVIEENKITAFEENEMGQFHGRSISSERPID